MTTMPVPQVVREALKENLTDRGIQQWWDRYCELNPAGSEGDALEAASGLVAYLENRSGYYI